MWRVGLLYRVHDLLVAVAEDQPDARRLHEAFRLFRGVRLTDVLNVAEKAKWLSGDTNGSLALTAHGRRLIEIEDPVLRLREQIAHLMDLLKPTWATAITQGRQVIAQYATPEVAQCFQEAGLFGNTSDDVVRWWDQRAAVFRAARDANLVNIGRAGERLSIAFERARIGGEPKWMSLDYNDCGYDLLSRVSRGDDRPLAIEVKTSSEPWETARFYLSRHEWEVLSNQENAVLHIWSIAREPHRHTVVEIGALRRHVAIDQGDGQWRNVTCPFRSWPPSDMSACPS